MTQEVLKNYTMMKYSLANIHGTYSPPIPIFMNPSTQKKDFIKKSANIYETLHKANIYEKEIKCPLPAKNIHETSLHQNL